MAQIINCVKTGKALPGMARPPFPGALGQRIFENISQQGWEMWKTQSTVIINHYGLNLADPDATKTLMEELEKFLFGEDARVPEDWVPEGEGTGKGAPSAKGAPSKGAPGRK